MPALPEPSKPRRAPALRLALVLGLLTVTITAMALTSGQMSDLREALPALSHAMNLLEGMRLPFDMDHVALFAMLACALRLLLPRLRWWWIGLGLAVLAGATELMQFDVAGRTPALLDARDDMIGTAIGLVVGAVLRGGWGWYARRRAG